MAFDMVKFANSLAGPKDVMSPVITLPQSCAGCAHFDGDAFCALPVREMVIRGRIEQADAVVCVLWAKKEAEAV